jgi:Nucleosome assembly protein (NAP)
LYERRHKTVSQIPNFWPLVIEQAPPEIDEYIQPSDSALLLSSLVSLSVSHFEIENGGQGNPRSVSIKWEFSENDYFEDRVVEKKFWYRRSKHGWSGFVSEPVDFRWKEGKDLTGGLLGMVKRVWEEEKALEREGKPRPKGLTAEQRALKKKIENTGLGGLSFFAWFGFRGRRVSAEESREVARKEQERLRLQREGKELETPPPSEEDEDEEDEDDLEIFPDGDNLAVTIVQDLWPGAIKYFSTSSLRSTFWQILF